MVRSAFGVESLQYMMMYAWNLWPAGTVTHLGGTKAAMAPLDRLGLILANVILKAEKNGLYREYVDRQEKTLVPKGSILLSQTLQLRARRDQRLMIEADEFSIDCPPNIALKEAVLGMLKCKVGQVVREKLLLAYAALSSVSDKITSGRELNVILLSARRSEYRLGLSIALLLKQSHLFGDRKSNYLFESPEINDEVLFRRLYEKFLREFYKFNLSGKVVGGRQYRWSESSSKLVPLMQTDINIEDDSHVMVVDAKCTPRVTVGRSDLSSSHTLNSAHLYQMFSYMSHAGKQSPGKRIGGLLIYPKYELCVDETIETQQGELRVVTVDFQCEWEQLSSGLIDLVATRSFS